MYNNLYKLQIECDIPQCEDCGADMTEQRNGDLLCDGCGAKVVYHSEGDSLSSEFISNPHRVKHDFTISRMVRDSERFTQWLHDKGHCAEAGMDTIIDGKHVSDPDVNQLFFDMYYLFVEECGL